MTKKSQLVYFASHSDYRSLASLAPDNLIERLESFEEQTFQEMQRQKFKRERDGLTLRLNDIKLLKE